MDSLTPKTQGGMAEACDRLKDEVIASLDGSTNSLKSTIKRAIWTVAIIQYIAIVGTIWIALHYLKF